MFFSISTLVLHMYKKFYGLQSRPFDIVPNPNLLFQSEKHSQALTYLRYGFSENIGFILFTGEIGAGKTTLLKYLLTQIDSDTEVAVVFNTNVEDSELLRLILIEFEIEGVGQDKSHNLDLLNTYLIEKYTKGRRCLLIIDEAQNLSVSALEEVRLLSNLQTDTEPLLQIILAGQPELREIIRGPGLEQLAQRVAVHYHLAPLSRDELGAYTTFRLNKAGGEGNLFDEEALDLIHQHSGGVPRTINIIANASLVYGYADSLTSISQATVQQVIDDKGFEVKVHEKAMVLEKVEAAPAEASGTVSVAETQHMVARISHLEAQLSRLTGEVQFQGQQVEGRLAEGHSALVQALETQIIQERVRSEKYLRQNVILAENNKVLQKQLKAAQAEEPKKEEKQKNGFFAALF